MPKKPRRLKISLAVKCQLLFGAAVVLIIAAALYVPWRRMQQLTSQLNEKAAGAVATNLIAEHVEEMTARRASPPTTSPSQPQSQPIVQDGYPFAPPRIISAAKPLQPSPEFSRFERSAYGHLLSDRERIFYSQDFFIKDGAWGYRYARPLRATQECTQCHVSSVNEAAAMLPLFPAQLPATQPSPKRLPLLGIVSVEIPSQIESSQILLNHIFILTAGLVAGTLAIIIFYLITTRLILQPVRVLQETAEKVSQGDLNIRSDISTGDEFQQLSETFNTMLANLKTSTDQLRAVNKSLDLKLGQLAESNVALYESNRLKSEFLANVSHELRTPLNSILGFAELLKESGGTPDAKNTRYLQNILASANNLLILINDLLDLAKIEAGRMEVRSEPISLNDLFEALNNLLKPLTEAKAVQIAITVASAVPIIHTDPAKLQQVLYNFLSNAIKFSPKEGTIELSAELLNAESIRISVTDHGPGIAPEQQQMIFEKFRQIDGSITRQHSGSGLGLAISKELIALLSGSIGVMSVPNEGSTFWVVLPLKIESGTQDVRGKLVLT
jgi:two-component system, NarL family, sensor histidine kinase BarA